MANEDAHLPSQALPHGQLPPGTSFFELSRLMVVGIDSARGQLIQKAQTSPNGPWAHGTNALWTINQMAMDSSEWEWNWTMLAASNLKQVVVVRDLTPPA